MRDLIRKPFVFSDGWLEVPDTPGLGIELNEKAFAGKPLKKWRRPLMLDRDGNIGYTITIGRFVTVMNSRIEGLDTK